MTRARVSGHERFTLDRGWTFASTAPSAATTPAALDALLTGGLQRQPALVPGTVASSLRALGRFSFDEGRDFDAFDHWFTAEVEVPSFEPDAHERLVLTLGGLATVADVFVDGELVLHSENMFVAHALDVSERARGRAKVAIAIRFHALGKLLEQKKPRPRWKTGLVRNQQQRWWRTTLLGRAPSWSPKVAPVGPYRPVAFEVRRAVEIVDVDVRPRLEIERDVGIVSVQARLRELGPAISGASLVVGEHRQALKIDRTGESPHAEVVIEGTLTIPAPARWMPHTHGSPIRHSAHVELTSDGAATTLIDLTPVAFRALTLDASDEGFTLRLDGAPIFCRGACWTTLDVVALGAPDETYRVALQQARDTGMNMLRVGGTMTYETDAFYDLCDELGILVWQDFMFANMDYPATDAAFVASVREEATQQLSRLSGRPSLAVLCGNSEIEQQAAMLGVSRELWRGPLFAEILPQLCAARCPDVAWVPSTPTGGALPFQCDVGITHYYGVGAYLRPLEDARRAEVRFTSECLGFANVPEQRVIDGLLGSGEAPVHHPKWKARVPRDASSGWDFDDVRDHYLGLLFRVDPMRLRYADMDRYLALSRVVTGEVMAATFGEWRRPRSTCHGALVWFLRDLWPGAGWGVLDSTGGAKPTARYLGRAFAPVTVLIADEGLNGLRLHALNERGVPFVGKLVLVLHRGETIVAKAEVSLNVAARGSVTLDAAALFPAFFDTTYAYRFGPAAHDLTVATLVDEVTSHVVAEAFHFPQGLPNERRDDLGLEAVVTAAEAGDFLLTLHARRFAQSVHVDVDGFEASDDYFHVAPGSSHAVRLSPKSGGASGSTVSKPRGVVEALNGTAAVKIHEAAP